MTLVPATLGRSERTCTTGGFVLTEAVYEPRAVLPRHRHALACATFAVSGSFAETIGTTTVQCDAFDVVVKPPAEAHSDAYGAGGTRCLLIEVEPARLASLGPLFDRWTRLRRDAVAPLASRLYREMRNADDSWALAVESLVLEIVVAGTRAATSRRPPRWLRDARAFVDENWSRKLTLADIAASVAVHPANVVRAFRSHLRCSPGEYVRKLRVEHACIALAESERGIAAIALDSGFYDQSHFAGVFKRHVGMTPSEYRARTRPPCGGGLLARRAG